MAADLGVNDFLLLSNGNESLALHVSETKGDPAETPHFAISTVCYKKEFRRLKALDLVAAEEVVFDWPGGVNFGMPDPDGGSLMLYEDYIVPAGR